MTTEMREFEGKNTEEAINAACRYFDATPEKLEIEILSTGSTGIFGLVGSKKARIRASLKQEQETPEQGVVAEAKKVLEQILSFLDIEATVSGDLEENTVTLNVEGESAGLLIGKKGKTLDAVQYIVTKIINKNSSRKIKVLVDTENYRQRHKQSLVDLALKMGEKAKRTGKPVTISPMNPADRRVVHIALQNDRSLKTRSKGEGLLKKVVILPQKANSESGRKSNQ